MRKTVSGMLLMLLLICVWTLGINVQPAKASGTIYIREDGSIDPPTAPISKLDNVTYSLTGNITSDGDGIVVERDNIVVDGSSFAVEGTGAYSVHGIYLDERSNVTIQNTNIKNFYDGIWLSSSSNNSINGNNITNNNGDGIGLGSSSNNSINGNNITNNLYGIGFDYSSNYNSISGNNVANNEYGIWLSSSSNNSISGNTMTDNYYGIGLSFSSNNSINGNNITNNGYDGIGLGSSSNNSINGNNITNNSYGIGFDYSSNNTVCRNNFINNTFQVDDLTPDYANSWDNGHEGNYWSNYTGTDANHDGTGDTPYIIDANNTDNYPLMTSYIIPEFPSFPILPLFVIATLLAVTICRRKSKVSDRAPTQSIQSVYHI